MNTMKIGKKIKDFTLSGEALDGETIIRLRKELEERLIESMREEGYVPVIDLLPQLYWEYNGSTFDYEILIYGKYVGKKRSQEVMGVLDFRPVFFEK